MLRSFEELNPFSLFHFEPTLFLHSAASTRVPAAFVELLLAAELKPVDGLNPEVVLKLEGVLKLEAVQWNVPEVCEALVEFAEELVEMIAVDAVETFELEVFALDVLEVEVFELDVFEVEVFVVLYCYQEQARPACRAMIVFSQVQARFSLGQALGFEAARSRIFVNCPLVALKLGQLQAILSPEHRQ